MNNSSSMRNFILGFLALCICSGLAGCWLAAGAAGAEAGYVASQENRSAGETIDDQLIHTSVKAKLVADPDVSGFNIDVDVYKGVVKLKGFVESQYEADKAVRLAREVDGVKKVSSHLVVDRS